LIWLISQLSVMLALDLFVCRAMSSLMMDVTASYSFRIEKTQNLRYLL
jgi:hypothetical protein